MSFSSRALTPRSGACSAVAGSSLTRVRPAATQAGETHPSIGGRGFGQRRGEDPHVRRLRLVAVLVWIALAACCVAVFGLTFEALVDAAGCAVLVAVTVTDLERRIVPNRIVVPALGVALVVQTARDPSVEWLVAAAVAGGFFLLLALVYPVGLGMGDVKLAAFMGAWLGRDVAVALFVGSLAGAIAAVIVLVLKGSSGRKVTLPYGPALAVGAVVGLFFGDALLDAWL